MAKKLIINADDFGLSQAVNEAVRTAHKEGVLTSATILTNMPAAEDAVKIAKELPNLGIGVHLNISKGKPISDDPQVRCLLDDNGQLYLRPWKLAPLAAVSHPARKALKIEFQAQIQRLIDNGIAPTHLDSHKHIHCFPAIYPIVCALAYKYKIPAVRFCYEPAEVATVPWPLSTAQGRKKAKILRCMARLNRLQNKDLIKTEFIYGISHMGKIDASFFKALSLYNRARATEVMTHPATSDDTETKDIMYKPKRKAEFEALCDLKTIGCFRDASIELVHYGQI